MKLVELRDEHPGKWNDGVLVLLAELTAHDGRKSLTGVRTPGSACKGMFGHREGPLQVIRERAPGIFSLTMSNLGTISREQRTKLLEKKAISHYRGVIRLLDWD